MVGRLFGYVGASDSDGLLVCKFQTRLQRPSRLPSVKVGDDYQRQENPLKATRLNPQPALDSRPSQVALDGVAEILRLYCQALTGADIAVHPAASLTRQGIGWVSEEQPTTEGTAIFLPPVVDATDDRAENFAIYKVYSTHQAAHLEFGSFSFRFNQPGALTGNQRSRWEAQRHQEAASPNGLGSHPATDLERFFDLFDDRRLAHDLFTVVEDARVDAYVRREYAGIRAPLQRSQQRELDRRPPLEQMPLRKALVENLVRVSLDGLGTVRWPVQLAFTMRAAIALLQPLQQAGATVEDSAEQTLRLYELAVSVPNVLAADLPAAAWQSMDPELAAAHLPSQAEIEQANQIEAPGDEARYESPERVGFRGEFKPELVQLLAALRDGNQKNGPRTFQRVSDEDLQALTRKSVELSGVDATNRIMANIREELLDLPPSRIGHATQPKKAGTEPDGSRARRPEYFYYDEWDYRTSQYRPRWCRVIQRSLREGDGAFYAETLAANAGLISQTRKQFEQLRPDVFRKHKRLYDGEDFDFDALVEYAVERKSGHTPEEKIYWRRHKIERDVAVAFLLDMSASTQEEVRRPNAGEEHDEAVDPYLAWTWQAREQALALHGPPKRIVDLEKEATVILVEALEALGDAYGIYGFSGYGRDHVEYFVVKDLGEPFGDRVKRRIGQIVPVRSTRMGAAIRHTMTRLDQRDAKQKILFLVSDGRPQDRGYGGGRGDTEYAIRDTKMALTEAKQKGVAPFCLTIDSDGSDYLRAMCADINYEVVADVKSLPARLPALYRRLTAL